MLDEADAIRKLRARADQRTADLIPALFIKMFGDPTTNPMGWPTAPLGDLVTVKGGATPSRATSDFWGGSIPWVSPKDMKRLEIGSSQESISETALRSTNISLIPKDAVLVVTRGMILAHTIPIAKAIAPVTINQDMKALVPNEQLTSDFLFWSLVMRSRTLLSQVSTAGHGTKRLETGDLLDLDIPIVPISGQRRLSNLLVNTPSVNSQRDSLIGERLNRALASLFLE